MSEEFTKTPDLWGGRYLILDSLAETPDHTVVLAMDLPTSQEVVIKSAYSGSRNSTDSGNSIFEKEFKILRQIPPHPSVVSPLESFSDQGFDRYVMKLAGRLNLYQYLNKFGHLEPEIAKNIFYRTCIGVEYLHDRGIIHGDLKPENIVLENSSLQPVLVDFESARITSKRELWSPVNLASFPYSAPELMNSNVQRENAVALDLWSLGILLYVLLTGEWPWNLEEWKCFENKPKIPDHSLVPEPAQRIIRSLVVFKPQQRASLRKVLSDSWFSDLEKSQRKNSRKSCSASLSSPTIQKTTNSFHNTKRKPPSLKILRSSKEKIKKIFKSTGDLQSNPSLGRFDSV